jgi:hypothetical protein
VSGKLKKADRTVFNIHLPVSLGPKEVERIDGWAKKAGRSFDEELQSLARFGFDYWSVDV